MIFFFVSFHSHSILATFIILQLTVLIMPGGNIRITGLPMAEGMVTEKALPEEIVKFLEDNPVKAKKERSKKKK